MGTKRRDSDESLTSATESDLVSQVNKLSTAISGTNDNVTILNERLTEYHRSHEEALRELQRSVMSPRFLESTPKISKGCFSDPTLDDKCPVQTLVTALREKDLSVSVLQKDNMSLREQLERTKGELEKAHAETRVERENLERWKRMLQSQLTNNISSVNQLIGSNFTIPPSVKRSLLTERPTQKDLILQQAELTSKLQWLCQNIPSRDAYLK